MQGIQPSPLALLAATCSRIGSTLHEDSVYTQKNITTAFLGKQKDDFTYTKSCLEGSRASIFQTLEHQRELQNYQQVQQQQGLCQPAPMYSTCMKIKHESDFDYNHNNTEQTQEGVHICPNVVTENRSYDSKSKLCCQENYNISSSSTSYNSNSLSYVNSCDSVGTQQQNSCLFQSSNSTSNNMTGNSSAISNSSHVNQSIGESLVSSLQNPGKSYHNWEHQEELKRHPIVSNELKSSCMVFSTYDNTTSPLQHYTSPPNLQHSTVRESRSSLSHIPASTELSSRQYSSPNVNPYASNNPQVSSFQSFPNYNSVIDEKSDSYQQIHQNFSPQPNYQASQTIPSNIPSTPTPLPPSALNIMPQQQAMNPALANTPIEVPPSFTNAYHPHVMGPPPNLHPNHPMANASLAEYQYQQQAFYAREYRRPRRIACTCPNCRDGENKTVTTKDGKQKKLHVCHVPGCGKIYGKTSHLRAHLRWHAGERPFACNWLFCNKRFTRSDELQRHRRTHTGDKRFECSICLKKFMRSDHLSKHMKTHQAQNNKNKDKNSDTKANSTNETKVKTAIKKENTNDSNTVSDVTDLKLNTSTA